MTGTSGDIYSPNWGNGNYHNGHDCTWGIEVTAGKVVKAELVTFSLYYDAVYVSLSYKFNTNFIFADYVNYILNAACTLYMGRPLICYHITCSKSI